MSTLSIPHIRIDPSGRAWIDQTNTKVAEIIAQKFAYGWSAEEIHFQHRHLSLAQIHAALGYYYDHQQEMDNEIQQQYKEFTGQRKLAGAQPFAERLRHEGRLP